MAKDSGTDERRTQQRKERDTFFRKMDSSPLHTMMRADAWEIEVDDSVPEKQIGQLYKSQLKLHYGSTDNYNTLLGNILSKNRQKNLQINMLKNLAMKKIE